MGNTCCIHQSIDTKQNTRPSLKASEKLFIKETQKQNLRESELQASRKISGSSISSKHSTCESTVSILLAYKNIVESVQTSQSIYIPIEQKQIRNYKEYLPKYSYFIQRRELVKNYIKYKQINIKLPFRMYPAPILRNLEENNFKKMRKLQKLAI